MLYTTAIDMWSFRCIVAELFLGLQLFPEISEFDLSKRMMKILGEQPPDHVLKESKNASKYFKYVGSVSQDENNQESSSGRSVYQALTEEEYEAFDDILNIVFASAPMVALIVGVLLDNTLDAHHARDERGIPWFDSMNGQYLCNRQITVSYAYKKDTKGERHGTPADRTLASSNPSTKKSRPHTMFASGPPTLPKVGHPNGAPIPLRPFANGAVAPVPPISALRPPPPGHLYQPMQMQQQITCVYASVGPLGVLIRFYLGKLNGQGLGRSEIMKWMPFGTLIANVAASCIMAAFATMKKLDGRISFEEFTAMVKARTDWKKTSRQYSRERYNNLSLRLFQDGLMDTANEGK